MHPNETLHTTLEKIFIKVLHSYPHQGFWAMASGAKSQTARRSQKNLKVFGQAKVDHLSSYPLSQANLPFLS